MCHGKICFFFSLIFCFSKIEDLFSVNFSNFLKSTHITSYWSACVSCEFGKNGGLDLESGHNHNMEPDSEQKAEASFLLRAGNLAAGTFNANVNIPSSPCIYSSRKIVADLLTKTQNFNNFVNLCLLEHALHYLLSDSVLTCLLRLRTESARWPSS